MMKYKVNPTQGLSRAVAPPAGAAADAAEIVVNPAHAAAPERAERE